MDTTSKKMSEKSSDIPAETPFLSEKNPPREDCWKDFEETGSIRAYLKYASTK